MLEVFALILAVVLFIIGIIGIIVPVLPSLPIVFVGILGYGWATQFEKITLPLIGLFAAIAIIGTLMDFIANAYGAKRFGASRYGIIGALLGSIIGIFLGPLGIIIGAFAGAIAFEFLFQKDSVRAWRAGIGTFLGFLFGTLLKIILVAVMIGIFFAKLF